MANRLTQQAFKRPDKKRCLSDLQSMGPTEVFQDSSFVPVAFSRESLFDGELVVKVFRNNTHACLQIFTFQYLELCFGKKSKNASYYLDSIYELIQKPEFEFSLSKSSSLIELSHMSLKNIISQYLNYMNETHDAVLSSLNKYPLILQIFVCFFWTMLYLGDICEHYDEPIRTDVVYDFLTSYFEVEGSMNNNIVHFHQANIYVYEKSARELYMAYEGQKFEKIDDSKFSSLLSKQEEIAYKSGISSVNFLISNIEIPEPEIDEKTPITSSSKTPKKKERRQASILPDENHSFPYSKLREVLENSVVSFNYTESFSTAKIKMTDDYGRRSSLMNKENAEVVEKDEGQHAAQAVNTSKMSKSLKGKISELMDTSQTFYRPAFMAEKKEANKIIYVSKDITKQFTSSFILNLMTEPYSSSVRAKKMKARQIRKSTNAPLY